MCVDLELLHVLQQTSGSCVTNKKYSKVLRMWSKHCPYEIYGLSSAKTACENMLKELTSNSEDSSEVYVQTFTSVLKAIEVLGEYDDCEDMSEERFWSDVINLLKHKG